MSVFSFHAAKAFHTVEDGALVCSDSGYTDKLKRLKDVKGIKLLYNDLDMAVAEKICDVVLE